MLTDRTFRLNVTCRVASRNHFGVFAISETMCMIVMAVFSSSHQVHFFMTHVALPLKLMILTKIHTQIQTLV